MKNIFFSIIWSICLCAIILMQGCKDENTVESPGLGSFYDPAVKPLVIYTYPANNSLGPFSGIFSGDNNSYEPHFKIQFNKIMNSEKMTDEYIQVTGFDEPVVVYSSSQYNAEMSGLYQFRLGQKNNSNNNSTPFYQLGRTYTVTVSGLLEDIHNQTLGKDFSFSFTIANTFKVISSTPKDSVSYGSYQIKILFNSLVDTSIISKINITPSIVGSWYFTNNGTALYFYPSSPYTPNVTYTITIAADAKDKFGNMLGKAYSYSFKSGEFKILYSYPSNNSTNVSLTNEISFYSNTSILNASIPAAFSITPNIAGSFSNYADNITFRPVESLKENTKYTVTLSNTLTAANGQTLAIPYSISFTTEGFRINQFYPYSSSASRYTNVEVLFNSKVDTTSAKAGFTIVPTVAGKVYFSNKNQTLVFRPDSMMAANTYYNVTLSNTIKSAQGNPLDYSNTYSFRTGD